jgi:hypothetical protein
MVRRWSVAMACALTLLWVTVSVAEKPARQRPRERPRVERPALTAEQEAVLDRGKQMQKDLRIVGLELALLEAKEAPEEDIALKAEDLYRLHGKLHALRVKNPEVARELRRLGRQEGRKLGLGRGRGHGGRGWGYGRAHGDRGRGYGRCHCAHGWGSGKQFGMGHGRVGGSGRGLDCPGSGFHRGHADGGGWGRGGGEGRGRGGAGWGRGRGGGPRMGHGGGGWGEHAPEAAEPPVASE